MGQACVIPYILDDELLFSYWRRLRALTPWESARRLAAGILDGHWRDLRCTMPTHLAKFQAFVGSDLGLEIDIVLNRHTLFPAYAAALPATRRIELRTRMLTSKPGPLLPALPIRSIDGFASTVMVCHLCQGESTRQEGTAPWKRLHNMPGLSICSVHCTPLAYTVRGQAVLAFEGRQLPNVRQLDNELRLAAAYRTLLTLSGDSLDNYRGRLFARAGIGPEGRAGNVREVRRLSTHLTDLFAAGFTSPTLSSMVEDPKVVTAALLATFRKRPKVHPIWTALIEAALADFSPRPDAPAIANDLNDVKLAETVLLSALQANLTLKAVAETTNVPIRALETLARRHEIDFSFRPSKITVELRSLVLSHLAAGQDFEAITARFAISLSSAHRILAACPKTQLKRALLLSARRLNAKRQRWTELTAHYPLRTAGELRAIDKGTWIWLYRHDLQWLEATSNLRAKRSNVAPAQASLRSSDHASESQILKAILSVKRRALMNPASRRQTVAQLIRGLGSVASRTSTVVHRLATLHAETPQDFAQRRLALAFKGLQSAGKAATPSALQRASRLRLKTLKSAGIDLDTWATTFARNRPKPI